MNDQHPIVHVAVGVIFGDDGRILLARRPDHLHMGGRWEFPGGKVEAGETVQQALSRELREEIGIEIELDSLSKLIEIRHAYAEKTVLLDTWQVRGFSGVASGQEGQEIAWVVADQLTSYQFPDANQPIITAIQGL